MGATRGVSFSPSAVSNLEEIRSWYADQQAPEVGGRRVGEIGEAVLRLAEFPESGRVVPEFGLAQLREIIHPPFRIVYRLDEARVRVVRVWRSERLMTMP
jgi:toxin ParE1/3/4